MVTLVASCSKLSQFLLRMHTYIGVGLLVILWCDKEAFVLVMGELASVLGYID